MIFDTHAHYDDDSFNEDRDSLLNKMSDNNVGKIVSVSADMKDIENKKILMNKYNFIYASVGVHPENVANLTDDDMLTIEKTALEPGFLAIGEIGLDYHYDDIPKEIQEKWFRAQLDIATKVNKPVIIHSREACEDTLRIMNDYPNLTCVMHCYSYSKETAEILLKKNFYFGIGGVVTFKNAKKLLEAVSYIPMDRILLETDCPYLSPEPLRGRRNNSTNIKYVVNKIAEIKNISAREVEDITWNNACRFYNLNN